jgi:hypothetical protein
MPMGSEGMAVLATDISLTVRQKGAPALVAAGMMGDGAVIFAGLQMPLPALPRRDQTLAGIEVDAERSWG